MSELYWLTVLGNLSSTFGVGCAISGILLAIFFIAYLANREDEDCYFEISRKGLRVSSIILIISIIGNIFIPCKHQLYMIYGVGGTIDYIKENPTAKQIPDKVIQACDAYLNNLIEKQNEDKEHN